MGCKEIIAVKILNPPLFFVGCDLSNGDKRLSYKKESSNSKKKGKKKGEGFNRRPIQQTNIWKCSL
jgi:hypothetical protein